MNARGFQPHRLDRFDVLAPLGAGGMADVFLARGAGVAGFERLFAIKRVRPQMLADEQAVALFIREARVTQNVRHPNIVDIVELQQDEHGLYMVLEYLDGPDAGRLTSSLSRAGLQWPWKLACHTVACVARGLAHAHAARAPDGQPLNLVHRDVSPSNILLSRTGQVKLSDFGVARASLSGSEGLTQAGALRGKLAYMAPEALQLGQVDVRTDVFAAGVVLWELLLGRPLFAGDGPLALHRILHEAVPAPSTLRRGLPAELDRVVARAVHKDPAKRYASAREMERELHSLIQGESPDALADALAMLIRDHGPPPRRVEGAGEGGAGGVTPGSGPEKLVPGPTPGVVSAVPPRAPPPRGPGYAATPAASSVAVPPAVTTPEGWLPPDKATPPPPEPPPAEDFFQDLVSAPTAMVTDWGAPPARFFALDAAGAQSSLDAGPLLAGLKEGRWVTLGATGTDGTSAADAAQRLLVDGLSWWPVRPRTPVAVAPAAQLGPWLDAQSGWLVLFAPDGTPRLGTWLQRGTVMLVLGADGAPCTLDGLMDAASLTALQRDAVVDAVTVKGSSARQALVSLGMSDARLRQVLDAQGIPRLRALAASDLVYALLPLPVAVHDVPPGTMTASAALGVAQAAPADLF